MTIEVIPIVVKKEVKKGDNLSEMLLSHFKDFQDGDILVVAQKIISKQEGRVISLANVIPSILAVGIAAEYEKDPKLIEVILSETKRIVRMESGIIITETSHGFVCANAGIDESNLPPGYASLLPSDPDASATNFLKTLKQKTNKRLALIISDTFGRPFREGQTNCAIGLAGMKAIDDYAGKKDVFDRLLRVTAIARADEICGAAELVMKKTKDCPFAVVRGYEFESADDNVKRLIRSKETDLFR
ncbi:MAG TPA: coenzyme F420-0:L-glutamate ligase [Candidatus Nitrosotenuis sp.]|nr:coenzyme F420-0:L-glutamate ligase [Candidatus Nitrosotenuis sp.]